MTLLWSSDITDSSFTIFDAIGNADSKKTVFVIKSNINGLVSGLYV